VKLFSNILTSTVWAEDAGTFRLWVALLALADANGMVDATIPGLAVLCRLTVSEVEAAMLKFMGPDKHSRSQEFEGRRVQKIAGQPGFLLLNYAKYREERNLERRREQTREAVRRHRQRSEAVSNGKPAVSQKEACKPDVSPREEEKKRRREEVETENGLSSAPSGADPDSPPQTQGEIGKDRKSVV